MIKEVTLKDFNGFTRTVHLGQFTLITGEVGSGKTSIWQAIQFVLSPIAAANVQEQFEHHYNRDGKTDSVSASLVIDDNTLTRQLDRNEKGITQSFFFNGNKVSQRDETAKLQEIGIVIATADDFLQMSDQKQIAFICQHFGQGDAIESLSNKIEVLRSKINDQQSKLLGQNSMIDRLKGIVEVSPVWTEGAETMLLNTISEVENLISIEKQRIAERRELAEKLRTAQLNAKLEAERLQSLKAAQQLQQQLEVEKLQSLQVKKQLEAEKVTVAQLKQQVENVQPVPAVVISQSTCDECLLSLRQILLLFEGEVSKCYNCGVELMKCSALIPLKLLLKKVKQGVK